MAKERASVPKHVDVFTGGVDGYFAYRIPSFIVAPNGDLLVVSMVDRRLLRWIDRPAGARPPDGVLTRRELRNFFQFNPRRADLRGLVVRHLSEWTPGGWMRELEQAPDFADLSPALRRHLVAQQITPTLWWTPEIARHAGLPASGMIYSYNPIAFLPWFEQMLEKHKEQRGAGIEGADRWAGKLPPGRLTLDSESAADMTDEEDYFSGEKGKQLTLEDLANGYPDDE